MEPKPHYIHLDFLRGIAALMVFVHHIRTIFFEDYKLLEYRNPLIDIFYFVTSFGHQAVMIFFVLSGCVICNSIESAYSKEKWSWQEYLISRLSRLWVVLLPALIIGGFLDILGLTFLKTSRAYSGGYPGFPSIAQIPSNIGASIFMGNACFLQTIIFPIFGSNAPLWSLAYEFWYYMIFPLFLFSFRGKYSKGWRITYFLMACAIMVFVGDNVRKGFLVWLFGAGSYYLFKYKRCSNLIIIKGMFWINIILMLIMLSTIRICKIWLRLGIYSDILLGTIVGFVVYWALQMSHREQSYTYLISKHISRPSYSLYVLHFPLLLLLSGIFIDTSKSWSLSLQTFIYFWVIFVVGVLYTYTIYTITEAKTSIVRNWLRGKLLKNY
jgi:peptidoglycan/LPS O-acetylase OafA/YrhL